MQFLSLLCVLFLLYSGQFMCGNKRCEIKDGLKSWEVNFAYVEQGEKRNALVKLRKSMVTLRYTSDCTERWIIWKIFHVNVLKVFVQSAPLNSTIITSKNISTFLHVNVCRYLNTQVLWSFLFQEKRSNRSEETALERRREEITAKEIQNTWTQGQAQTQEETERQVSVL